jgi:hypothetical protein
MGELCRSYENRNVALAVKNLIRLCAYKEENVVAQKGQLDFGFIFC